MSWSTNITGNPDKITEALDKQSQELTGQSKAEFDAALPHLKGLLALNYHENGASPVIEFSANGHGHDGYSNCNVSIKPHSNQLV